MNKEIDSVRIYQAVTFEKRSETFFSTRSISNKEGRSITINEQFHGIEIQSDNDHIFVPFTNVSCVYFRSKLRKQQIEDAKNMATKKTGVKPTEIKRPSK